MPNMLTGEDTTEYEVTTGFTTTQRFSSKKLTRKDQLYIGSNVNLSDNLGVASVSEGYEYHSSVGAGEILGFYGFTSSAGISIPVAVFGTTIYYWNGSSWTASGTTALTAGKKMRFTSFLDWIFALNGSQFLSSNNGSSWGSTQLTGAPTGGLYVFVYGERLIVLTQKSIYWSSLPNASLNISWDTTNWTVDPNPYDDGGLITGGIRLRKRALIFKQFAIYRFLQYGDKQVDLLPIDETTGTHSQESIIVYKNKCYFWGTEKDGKCGIYMTDGENVQLISRPIQDIINGVSQSFWENITATFKKGIIKWYVNDVTVTEDGVSTIYPYLEIRYSVSDNSWSWRKIKNAVRFYSATNFGSARDIYFADSTGKIFRDDYGSVFKVDGSTSFPIEMELVTHPFNIVGLTKSHKSRGICITGSNLENLQVQLRSLERPTDWTTIKNISDKSHLFLGAFDKTGSFWQLRVASPEYGSKVEGVNLIFQRGGGELT